VNVEFAYIRAHLHTYTRVHTASQEEKDLQKARPGVHMPPIVVPETIVLEDNYRTHDGILKMAASIIDLLQNSFPNSSDRLPRERGYFQGPVPIYLQATSVEKAVKLIVGGSDKKKTNIE
jgi:hypothetical protein